MISPAVAAASTPAAAEHPVKAALLLGALGVVFGDIGTSPIYAFREFIEGSGQPVRGSHRARCLVAGILGSVLIVALK